MAENRSIKKEDTYWRRVVLRWVKCAELNLSQDNIDLARCYDNFKAKIKETYELREDTAVEFLRTKFPHFQLKLTKENEIPECDYVYVLSLMLYFTCVEHSIPFFQNIGLAFEEPFQYSMKAFLNSFVPEHEKQIVINRAFLDKAFLNAKRSVNVLREQCSNNIINIHHPAGKGKQLQSKPASGNQETRKSSPTKPNGVTALEWKVKNLSTHLDAARSENIVQEKQIEQLLRNVQELQWEKKRNLAKISALQQKEPACSCTKSSADLTHRMNRVTEQLQKQLESKSNCIELLQEEIAKAKEGASKEVERWKLVKKQCASLIEDNRLLNMTVEALQEELTLKDSINQNLGEAVGDLRRFIRENRIHGTGMMDSFESSFDFSDNSFRLPTPDASVCNDSETLAATVVDIKLKEKERENEALEQKVQELEDKLKDLHKSQNEKLRRQEVEANQKLSELRRSLEETETSRSKLADSLEREKARTEDLTRRTEEWKVQQKRSTMELERLSALYEEKRCQYEQSQQDCDNLWVKLYKARSTLEENEKRWTLERTALKKLFEDSMQVLEMKHHKSEVELQRKTEEMADRMKQQHENIITKLESDKQGLVLKVDDHHRTIGKLETRCRLLQKELTESLNDNQQLHSKLKAAKDVSSDRKSSSLVQPDQTNLRINSKIKDCLGELFNKINSENRHSASSLPIDAAVDVVPELETKAIALDCAPKPQAIVGRCTRRQPPSDATIGTGTKTSGRRKGVQRKVLYDSNRNLLERGSCQQDFVGTKYEAVQPLNSILECPLSIQLPQKERSVSLLPTISSIAPVNITPRTTLLRTTNFTDNTLPTANTTISTLTTASATDPAISPVVKDYSFSQPYGSNRYNILRMQVQSRAKRRQLCDQTRKLASKGRSHSTGSPAGVLAHRKDYNSEAESCSDVTLYLSFTNDTDYDQQQDERSSNNTSLFLVLLAYVGMLAQIFFFFGGLAIRTKRLKSGRT